MFYPKHGSTRIKYQLISAFLLLMWVSMSSFAQQNCLTIQNIQNLLEKKVDQLEIIKLIEKFGVDFELDTKTTTKLVRAGASDALLEVISQHLCTDLNIIRPTDGQECGSSVKVEGKSKGFPGKFLWIFAHVKYLRNMWWPQMNAVNLEPNGHWEMIAFLGGPQDVGFEFEITATWVDSSSNKMLNDYMTAGNQTGNYPGIKLPEGSPSTNVTVKKVR
jgi:hypothetical protein